MTGPSKFMYSGVKCALSGCGREVPRNKVESWKRRNRNKKFTKGPYCSNECYWDARKTKY